MVPRLIVFKEFDALTSCDTIRKRWGVGIAVGGGSFIIENEKPGLDRVITTYFIVNVVTIKHISATPDLLLRS